MEGSTASVRQHRDHVDKHIGIEVVGNEVARVTPQEGHRTVRCEASRGDSSFPNATSLHNAGWKRNMEMVKLLVELGADPLM